MQIDIEVDVQAADFIEEGWLPKIDSVAKKALIHQSVSADAALTILLTDDEALHQLNLTHRNEDKPTDVLSFESGEVWPDGTLYLGDIAISLPTAERQAAENQKTFLEEIELLAVHGVLHLLGYDHADPEEEAQMWALQREILT